MPSEGETNVARVVVVDDDAHHLRGVERRLRAERWEVQPFVSGADAIRALEEQDGACEVLVTDLYMPEMGGLELLRTVHERWPSMTLVLMTGRADIATAVEAMRGGAYDYLVKPFEPDALVQSVRRGIERSRLLDRNLYIQRQLDVADRVEGLVGLSPPMREVLTLIATVAPTDATVLVLGESGTGKELVAKSIHRQSQRAAQAFVPINCGALSETVLESELFGHARGAFTGATTARRGLFEEASGGTLFLDEVGELSPATQVRLLRALQEGEVRPVGSNHDVSVDVRVIAATNRDLRAEVKTGNFRRDLYYRLEVITIELPPLRQRLEDLPSLVHHLVLKRAARLRKSVTSVDEEVLARLAAYDWPGNIRELENVIERAIVMTRGDVILPEVLPSHLRNAVSPVPQGAPEADAGPLAEARDVFERRYVSAALARAGGNLSEAARSAGLDRSNFRRLLKRLGLDVPSGSEAD